MAKEMVDTYKEAKAKPSEKKEVKRKTKKISHIQIKKAKNGGHIVTHHYENDGGGMVMGPYRSPEDHSFGSDEGHKLITHVGKVMGVNPGGQDTPGEHDPAVDDENDG